MREGSLLLVRRIKLCMRKRGLTVRNLAKHQKIDEILPLSLVLLLLYFSSPPLFLLILSQTLLLSFPHPFILYLSLGCLASISSLTSLLICFRQTPSPFPSITKHRLSLSFVNWLYFSPRSFSLVPSIARAPKANLLFRIY